MNIARTTRMAAVVICLFSAILMSIGVSWASTLYVNRDGSSAQMGSLTIKLLDDDGTLSTPAQSNTIPKSCHNPDLKWNSATNQGWLLVGMDDSADPAWSGAVDSNGVFSPITSGTVTCTTDPGKPYTVWADSGLSLRACTSADIVGYGTCTNGTQTAIYPSTCTAPATPATKTCTIGLPACTDADIVGYGTCTNGIQTAIYPSTCTAPATPKTQTCGTTPPAGYTELTKLCDTGQPFATVTGNSVRYFHFTIPAGKSWASFTAEDANNYTRVDVVVKRGSPITIDEYNNITSAYYAATTPSYLMASGPTYYYYILGRGVSSYGTILNLNFSPALTANTDFYAIVVNRTGRSTLERDYFCY